jgi:hypothetical protein
MSEKISFEEQLPPEETKEIRSDSCLEKIVVNMNDCKSFYESKFVQDTKEDELDFSIQEKEAMLKILEQLKDNIFNEYEDKQELNIEKESQLNHILGNSILILAKRKADQYENGKEISEKARGIIKKEMSRLNYYITELSENKDLLEEEMTHEDGHLQKFTKFFTRKINTRSLKRIIIFKFFRDLETDGIKKEDFLNRLEEIDKETEIKNFLGIHALEREGLILIKDKDSEIYKYT